MAGLVIPVKHGEPIVRGLSPSGSRQRRFGGREVRGMRAGSGRRASDAIPCATGETAAGTTAGATAEITGETERRAPCTSP